MSYKKLEYIWLDGNTPTPSLRSKVKILNTQEKIRNFPLWNFDGSSTKQANTNSSDCILQPVRFYTSNEQHYYVMCEVLNSDMSPHVSNFRHSILEQDDFWFGFEQEYFFYNNDTGRPLGWSSEPDSYPEPQGKYYCSVGSSAVGRKIVDEHLELCLSLGLNITGINAEVAKGQWEYQLLGIGTKNAADDLWLSRYLLHKICEEWNVRVEFHPKPLGDTDWNGSGMHTNFSNEQMRNDGDPEFFIRIIKSLEERHQMHIEAYGADNHLRLTGKHETCSISEFRAGVSDRGASIRIPLLTSTSNKGYLEDRRPASSADPYKVVDLIAKAVIEA